MLYTERMSSIIEEKWSPSRFQALFAATELWSSSHMDIVEMFEKRDSVLVYRIGPDHVIHYNLTMSNFL